MITETTPKTAIYFSQCQSTADVARLVYTDEQLREYMDYEYPKSFELVGKSRGNRSVAAIQKMLADESGFFLDLVEFAHPPDDLENEIDQVGRVANVGGAVDGLRELLGMCSGMQEPMQPNI